MYRNHSENGHNNINFEDNQCVVTTTNFHQYNWIYHMEHLGNDKEHVIDKNLLVYINRLSDFLFVFARVLEEKKGNTNFFWQK